MSLVRRLILLALLGFLSYSLYHNWVGLNEKEDVKPAVQLSSIAADVANLTQRYVVVDAPLYVAHFDRVGGKLVQVALKDYTQSVNGKTMETMLSGDSKHPLYGYIGAKGDESIIYNSPEQKLEIEPGKTSLTLTGKSSDGVIYEKTFNFNPQNYVMKVQASVHNTGNKPYTGFFYMGYSGERSTKLTNNKTVPTAGEFLAGTAKAKQSGFFSGLSTFAGAAYHSSKKSYAKVPYDAMAKDPLNVNIRDAWGAVQKHYFLSAIIPESSQTYHLSTSWQDGYMTGSPDIYLQQFEFFFRSLEFNLDSGNKASTQATMYTGPEITENLKGLAPGLELTVDYGFLWIISYVLFWIMDTIHTYIHNWGLSIILLTALIKLVFYKFSETSYRAMARMKTLKPKLDALNEQYKDDPQGKNQAMIEFYRKEKLNPLGSCLPLLIQIPFFIAFYNVLIESVELRHVPFLWLPDLAAMDPYFILPLLMGLSMLVQQKISPQPDDPMQANMMYITPVIFTVMFAAVPSGLVLYWLANNVFSILQQWAVTARQ